MSRMKALKSFRVSDTGIIVQAGEEFEARNAQQYEARGMAIPIAPIPAQTQPIENKAASAGPLASPGGKTGEERLQSLSPAGLAPKTRRSKMQEGERDS